MAKDMPSGAARPAELTYVHDHDPGISRTIDARGVTYRAPGGQAVRDQATLARIAALVIPPAWTAVWICPDPDGHIQAVGRDARGRKQYRYHPAWRAHRDEAKYERLRAFGAALPKLRARVEADLAHRGLPREKVLAAVVRLLELTLIRIGNDEYARVNKSFGLTTLRKRHVTLSGVGAVFEFRGKSGVSHRTAFHDRRLAGVLRGCEALPGQRLFQFIDETGVRHAIGSGEVNAYLHEAMGEAFSAKDFRTWSGTLAAARELAPKAAPESEAELKRDLIDCVKAVAALLGNTPTVCRACYIHPVVFEAFAGGSLPSRLAAPARGAELALLKLLGGGKAGAAGA